MPPPYAVVQYILATGNARPRSVQLVAARIGTELTILVQSVSVFGRQERNPFDLGCNLTATSHQSVKGSGTNPACPVQGIMMMASRPRGDLVPERIPAIEIETEAVGDGECGTDRSTGRIRKNTPPRRCDALTWSSPRTDTACPRLDLG
eukprot:1570045-Rhodomonas_salina.1